MSNFNLSETIAKQDKILEDKIKSFQDLYETMVNWNKDNLSDFVKTFSSNVAKLQKIYFNVFKFKNDIEAKLNTLYQEKYTYYKFDFDIKLSDQEIKKFIQSDYTYASLQSLLNKINKFLDIIEDAIKNLNNTRYDIKNFIEWQKFISVT